MLEALDPLLRTKEACKVYYFMPCSRSACMWCARGASSAGDV